MQAADSAVMDLTAVAASPGPLAERASGLLERLRRIVPFLRSGGHDVLNKLNASLMNEAGFVAKRDHILVRDEDARVAVPKIWRVRFVIPMALVSMLIDILPHQNGERNRAFVSLDRLLQTVRRGKHAAPRLGVEGHA